MIITKLLIRIAVFILILWIITFAFNLPYEVLFFSVLLCGIILMELLEYRLKHRRIIKLMESGSLAKELFKNLYIIENITQSGFEVLHDDKRTPVLWADASSIYFTKDFSHLVVKAKSGTLDLPDSSLNWYKLIKSVPTSFRSFDFDYVENLFSSLTTCEICGSVANKEKNALSADAMTFNQQFIRNLAQRMNILNQNS